MRVDLHTHSTASDGTDAPADLPRLAKAAGLDGFALTDHDTTAGLVVAERAAKKLGVRFVPGIELSVHADPFATHTHTIDSAASPAAGSLHLLGYHVQHDVPELAALSQRLRDARATRNPQIIEKLQALGVRIHEDDLIALNNADETQTSIGRPHIAQLLVQRGYVKSIHEAFAKYLGQGAAAYVPRELPTAAQAINAVHAAQGVAVLAHPVHLRLDADGLEHAIAKLADLGLDGIETRHPDHEPADTKQLADLGERFDLIPTGGSDYHGSRKAITLGSVVAPDHTLEKLEEAAAQYA